MLKDWNVKRGWVLFFFLISSPAWGDNKGASVTQAELRHWKERKQALPGSPTRCGQYPQHECVYHPDKDPDISAESSSEAGRESNSLQGYQGLRPQADPASGPRRACPLDYLGMGPAGCPSGCPGSSRDSDFHWPAAQNFLGGLRPTPQGATVNNTERNPVSSTNSRYKGLFVCLFLSSFPFLLFFYFSYFYHSF